MIGRAVVLSLGLSQFISWGVSYYLIGVFADRIVADLQWSREFVYGGFSAGLLVMGLSSTFAGAAIDRWGGVVPMAVGAALDALGCLLLANADGRQVYLGAWVLLGLGMRLTLYDAAFAALAKIAGRSARRPMAQITLFGGLASTAFWPLGEFLCEAYGWRSALLIYAVIALVAGPLGCACAWARRPVAADRHDKAEPSEIMPAGGRRMIAAFLFTAIVTISGFISSGMSAHMIAILSGLGSGVAVAAASMRGVGQSAARLCEVLLGRNTDPFRMTLLATVLVPLGFCAALFASHGWIAAMLFTLTYGAGNGLLTIAGGSLPLALFDHRTYGAFVGRLIAPSFVLSAAAPVSFAFVIREFGDLVAVWLALALGIVACACAIALLLLFGNTPSRSETRQ